MSKDEIYTRDGGSPGPFEFNDGVADVFPDMLARSVPGYAMTIEAIGSLARRFVRTNTICYDLGCSLGAAARAMRDNIAEPGCRVIAVDNAPAMVARCKAELTSSATVVVEVLESDLACVAMSNASMVVMNYTLQFLDVLARDDMITKIFDGLLPGGLLLLSEKVVDEDPQMEKLLVGLHHEHKRRNAYSELEISRKRAALENVLIPEPVAMHFRRLRGAGFAHTAVWLRYFNFVSLVAIK